MTPRWRGPGLLYADDSGGDADALRSLAVLSGPARVLLALERDLRQALKLYGVDELKWAALRTRKDRLQAAQACLDLLCVALEAKAVHCHIVLWRPKAQGPLYRARTEPERLRPLYAHVWGAAARAWRFKAWRAYPDQRTGMEWQRWSREQRGAWRKAGLGRVTVREASSKRSACVQLADLLAGLARLQARVQEDDAGARAHQNRMALLNHWILTGAARGLRLDFEAGHLRALQPQLSIRLLSRLPTRA